MFKLRDFQCQTCHFTFEELLDSQDPKPICPKCQGLTNALFPLISPTLKPATDKYNEAMMGNNCTKQFVDK